MIIPSLLYRYEFSKAGEDPVEYDPMYQLIRPINFYVRAKRRTEWPEPTTKYAPEPKLENTAEAIAKSGTAAEGESVVDKTAKPNGKSVVEVAVEAEAV